jgi:hypothetical protein
VKREANLVTAALLTWLAFALVIGSSGRFSYASPRQVAATVWMLTALALLACWKIRPVRDRAADIDVRWLIAVHLTRFVGIYFLVLAAHGGLPSGFARPAGIGDITIAAGAAIILLLRQAAPKSLLFAWNALGLIDILFVVFAALRFGLRDSQSMTPVRELPLSLLPTFIVPLIITSHVVIFARLRVGLAARA